MLIIYSNNLILSIGSRTTCFVGSNIEFLVQNNVLSVSSCYTFSIDSVIQYNQWSHVALIYDSLKNISLYMVIVRFCLRVFWTDNYYYQDGNLISINSKVTLNTNSKCLRIGKSCGPESYTGNGFIENLRIIDNSLTLVIELSTIKLEFTF